MTEILTESFCERCGTRYTFESARPKTRLKGVKVLSRGLKNFVLSDDTSIDEAMAAARNETDRESTAHQLDAFHKTFNFCMSCRQYTCPNCWNEAEARCLSCAPLALPEAPAAFDDLTSLRAAVLIGQPTPGNGTADHGHEAWPDGVATETEAEAAAAVTGAETDAEPLAAVAEPIAEPVATQAEEPIAAQAEEPTSTEAVDPVGKAAHQTASLLRRFRPGQNLDAELDAYERERTDAGALAADSTIESAAEAALEPGAQAAASEPEAEAASAESSAATGEPAAAADETAPVAEPIAAQAEPEPVPQAAAAAADVVEQPTWRITAPDPTGAPPIGRSPERDAAVPLQASASATDGPAAEPQWPAKPQWRSSTPAAGLPFLGRPAAPQGGIDALWAASNQELVAAPAAPGRSAASGIQPCVSCGLSLSANARFCRRCGTLQGR